MHRHRICMVACALLLLGHSGPLRGDTLSLNDRIWMLSKTYQSISIYFAHWETAAYVPEEADSVFKAFLGRAIATEDRADFSLLMREYIALLRNGHCWYSDFAEYRNQLPLGFDWRHMDGGWIVTGSRIPGLSAGDIIDSINGRSAEDSYQALCHLTSGSSEYGRRESFARWTLIPYLPQSYAVAARGSDGAFKRLTVDRSKIAPDESPSKTTGEWIREPEVALITIPSFAESSFEDEALRFLELYRHATSLIVDVRGNGGGNTPSKLTAALMDRPYRWYTESTPLTIALFRYYAETDGPWWGKFARSHLGWFSAYEGPDSIFYSGRLILLVDRGTGSAAEDFVMPFKDNGRALIIGEPTKGSTGQPYSYRFDDIGSIGIGAKRAWMPDGSRFEGIGIQPDVTVVTTRQDLYNSIDPVMQRATAETSD